MTTGTPIALNRSAYLNAGNDQFNLWWQLSFFLLGLFAITGLLWWIDPRQLDGVSVWTKPLKFELSLIVYAITMTLLASLLPTIIRNKKTWKWATRFAVSAAIFEIVYILIQAARGRASHYNESTPVEYMMYALMGVGAVTLVTVSCYLGWLLYRSHYNDEPRVLKLAAAWGLITGSVLTLITAGVMSNLPSHFAGTPDVNAWFVPIMGWSASGGDLRIPHFFATHLMQFLPLYGLWLQRRSVSLNKARPGIMFFAVIYSAVVLAWFAAAFLW